MIFLPRKWEKLRHLNHAGGLQVAPLQIHGSVA